MDMDKAIKISTEQVKRNRILAVLCEDARYTIHAKGHKDVADALETVLEEVLHIQAQEKLR